MKSYTVIAIDRDLVEEVFYPSGYVDLVINISGGNATTIIDGCSRKTPGVELLGHITLPSRLTVTKGTMVLIARFHPYASSLFFPDRMSVFTNLATDARGIFSGEITDFYDQLMEARTLRQKIGVLETFLIRKLANNEKRIRKAGLLQQVCGQIRQAGDDPDGKSLSARYGFSERYIQRLFTEMVGITPGAYHSVYRFNRSLVQVLSPHHSLTSIAYDCGYFDQAHFIKEFRKFTGITPFDARASLAAKGEKFQEAVNIGF